MLGGSDPRRMSVEIPPESPLAINSRPMVSFDPSTHGGQSSPFAREGMQNGAFSQKAESMVNYSKKLQEDLQELGQKIKHHEDNVKFLKTMKNKLDESTIDLQVTIGKYHTSFSGSEEIAHVDNEEETIQHILRHENSAAALLCKIQSKHGAQVSDYPFTKDVLGIVATLAKVDNDNLSRVLAGYLGIGIMLAVVCKTYEGVKALEAHNRDGSINNSFGLHAVAASTGSSLDEQFLVICLENLRLYDGEVMADDPQRRLDIRKPRLFTGETPPGFLGFAVNMVSIDPTNLYHVSKTGHTLRETLFYSLFSNLQVYKSREHMLKALPCITDGAISLDGGVIKSPGIFSLGHHRGDSTDVKFPSGSKKNLPESYFDIETRTKETKWKKDRIWEDLQREQALADQAKFNYETKKREFLQFLAESSSYVNQVGRVSTPR